MLQTTNYNLKKPELTDSPPDITVMNPNWDAIDAEMHSHGEQINTLATYAVTAATDANNISNGRYAGTNLTNAPTTGTIYYDSYVSGSYGWQQAKSMSSPSLNYFRGLVGGTWSAWNQIATTEQGTWTPILTGSTVAGTNTYSVQIGKYYKIGRLVHLEFKIQLSTKDANMAGLLKLQGLPFYLPSTGTGVVKFGQYGFVDFPTGYTDLNSMIYSGGSDIFFYMGGDNVALSTINSTQISSTTYIYGSVDYITA